MELSKRDGCCAVCFEVVTARQHALECDDCRRVHRLCGTGISYTQYRDIMENLRHGGTFPWRCQSCATTTHQLAATFQENGEACDDGKTDHVDSGPSAIGTPTFQSTRLDATFQYVLCYLLITHITAKYYSDLWRERKIFMKCKHDYLLW